MKTKKLIGWLIAIVVVVGVLFFGYVQYDLHRSYDTPPEVTGGDTAARIERGYQVAIASDCVACHTGANTAPFAGGYPIKTPFGTVVASNITQDKETGIGSWDKAQFDRAVRHGKGRDGYLYGAMPYTAYTKMSDQDLDDLWAYMKTIPAVSNRVEEDQLPFPFNQRFVLAGWNLLFFKDQRFVPDSARSEEQNRGAYLVDGLAHCTTCHTPKNALGGDTSDYLGGAALGNWFASDLTNNPHTGLGKWSAEDIQTYLHRGSNRLSVASGPMAEAVENSTQHMSEADLKAISSYLKGLPATSPSAPTALAASDPQMASGKRIYEVACSACHTGAGAGVRDMIPTLAGNSQLQSDNVSSLLNVVLSGAPGADTEANPTSAGMPRFDWKLSDQQIADVATYIRNSWGNAAAPVKADQVSKARAQLKAADYVVKQQ